MRVVIWPAIIEVIMTPTIMGVSSRPLTVGEAPCTVCWYSGRNVIAPNMASPARKLSPVTSAKFRFRKMCSGRIGSAARDSIMRNRATLTTASAPRPRICGEAHEYWLPPQVEMSTTDQPRTSENRAQLLARYSDIVGRRLPVLRFLEQNQAAVHHLMTDGDHADRKKLFRTQFETLRDLLAGPGEPLRERVRASVAVISVGVSCMLFDRDASAPGELRGIVLETACELAGVTPPEPGESVN